MRNLDTWKFVIQVAVAVVGIVSLLLVFTEASIARKEAQDSASQVEASRLDELYRPLLDMDEFFSSADNRNINLLWRNHTRFSEVGDPAVRAQLKQTNVWSLDYFEYVYTNLIRLVDCAPADGHFILRGSPEDKGKCPQWTEWSESFYRNFQNPNLCSTLHALVSFYDVRMVAALRRIGACSA
ncbi:hypothetical protein [Streptomyces sp. HPF1205]|uniref:hypothetical protein n=1 Tax=Streptomyces sp. HPF1205 TaxID=2873262 RepID=UPI001CECB57C|nr:hypothetical protein [Streptomyces sp. HPF1205]